MSAVTQVVTLDGPAGAGKSTVARRVALELGFTHMDTGAMFRAATWWAMRNGIDFADAAAVAKAVREMELKLDITADGLRVYVGGEEVTREIRTPEVTRNIVRVDQNPEVRAHLAVLQRAFAAKGPTVAEGRDMGTVIFPDARCKIYLDASLEERARRRAAQWAIQPSAEEFERLVADIHERDEQSRKRAIAPLTPAADAVILDTTHLSEDEVVERVVRLARERI